MRLSQSSNVLTNILLLLQRSRGSIDLEVSGVSKRSLPISVPLTREEFSKLRQLQIKFRWDWTATFSANEHGHIWPYITPGYTTEDNRFHVRGALELLDYLADEYVSIRPGGGRFFIDDHGAYYSESSNHVQFGKFVFVSESELG